MVCRVHPRQGIYRRRHICITDEPELGPPDRLDFGAKLPCVNVGHGHAGWCGNHCPMRTAGRHVRVREMLRRLRDQRQSPTGNNENA